MLLGISLSFCFIFEVLSTKTYALLPQRPLHLKIPKPLILVTGLTLSQHKSIRLLLPWNSLWLHVRWYGPSQPYNNVATSSVSKHNVNMHFLSESQNDKSSFLINPIQLNSIKLRDRASPWAWPSWTSASRTPSPWWTSSFSSFLPQRS